MNRMRWDRLARLALLLVAPLGVAACGSGGVAKSPAEGTVSFKGQPLATGQVQFQPEAPNAPSATGLVENGKFTLGTEVDGDGAPPGKYRVSVFSYKTVQSRYGETTSQSMIPDRYSKPDSSGLVVEIPPGGNRAIKIELADETKPRGSPR
jgi:hypothetical protein